MQTFLPYADYAKSAQVLDRQRLGKQRVECLQILNVLLGISKTKGWQNHPAVLMWKNHEISLARYGWHVCNEWIQRGYKDTCKEKILSLLGSTNILTGANPSWLGNNSFHASHRSNLLRKNPEWYAQFNWTERHDLPYIWPV